MGSIEDQSVESLREGACYFPQGNPSWGVRAGAGDVGREGRKRVFPVGVCGTDEMQNAEL